MNTSRKPLCYCGILLGLVVLGCGKDDKLTPVRGQVFYRDQPLNGGTIVFTPDPERGGHGPLAYGEVGADGHYTLHTGDSQGAVPGWHRVTVAPSSPIAPLGQGDQPLTGGMPVSSPAFALPRKYSDPKQSGLFREIKADKIVEQDFHLE